MVIFEEVTFRTGSAVINTREEREEMTEPIVSALVLAGKGATEIATPKIRELLLGPLAKAYGDHWGTEVEERLRKRREEKRAKNTHAHVQAVALLEPRRSFEDVADDPVFDEWLQGAAEIDANIDPDLANFWRAALVALADGDMDRLRLLRIVRSLGPDDAVYMATARVTHGRLHPLPQFSRNSDNLKRLETAGVVESPWRSLLEQSAQLIALFVLPFALYAMTSFMAFTNRIPIEADGILKLAVPMAVLGFLTSALYVVRRLAYKARRLTSDGEKLLSLLNRVRTRSN